MRELDKDQQIGINCAVSFFLGVKPMLSISSSSTAFLNAVGPIVEEITEEPLDDASKSGHRLAFYVLKFLNLILSNPIPGVPTLLKKIVFAFIGAMSDMAPKEKETARLLTMQVLSNCFPKRFGKPEYEANIIPWENALKVIITEDPSSLDNES